MAAAHVDLDEVMLMSAGGVRSLIPASAAERAFRRFAERADDVGMVIAHNALAVSVEPDHPVLVAMRERIATARAAALVARRDGSTSRGEGASEDLWDLDGIGFLSVDPAVGRVDVEERIPCRATAPEKAGKDATGNGDEEEKLPIPQFQAPDDETAVGRKNVDARHLAGSGTEATKVQGGPQGAGAVALENGGSLLDGAEGANDNSTREDG